MVRLRTKLTLFNLLSKLVFTAIFIAFMPFIVDRINILQTDNDLIEKREQVINLISEIGIEPFIYSDTAGTFGSYNILKEEFVSLERVNLSEDWNFIEVTERLIENEIIQYRVLNYSFIVDGQSYLLEIGRSQTSILTTRKNIKIVILIFLIFIILITFISDLIYAIRVLKPFDNIIKKLKGTSSPALFDKDPVKTTTSDFRLLDQTITELMSEIDDLFRKEKDITVNISHELMTPISVLRSKLENIILRENIDPDIATGVEESLTTLHRLKTLVNSLLLIARIESRQYLKNENFLLVELLTDVINEISVIAEDAGIILKTEFDEDYLFKNANRSLVFSMFYNVINNAVKNTSQGGDIIIRGGYSEKVFEVSVSDTGRGMDVEQVNNLFSRFSRKTYSEGESGTGIGLAITKSIADFHNINITVSSVPCKGTTFSFFFFENS